MSRTHGSSAYSFAWVCPVTSESAAATMSSCQPQKWNFDSPSLKSRVFSSRCIEW